jgi:class 3 adenylate cyclase
VIVCSKCGQENPDNARFCLACGRELVPDTAPRREERRVVSVIFVDLVGFTERSEKLDPEDVQAILAPYHDCVRGEIESFGGLVEKFVGDAVVGLFGAPTAFGDDAERATRAALAVRDSVRELNGRSPGLELQLRIAVNTGEALVTVDARPELGEAMVAGDVVNTASRLQNAAPTNGIVVGAETHRLTRDAIFYEPSEPVIAKGKSAPVEAWLALEAAIPVGERGGARAPLVGRVHELGVLREIWERAAAERKPHLVTVLGQPGVGKTRLATEFGGAVEEVGGCIIHGRSLPYRESSAYFAFAIQVKQLCGIFESDPAEVALQKLRERVATLVAPGEAQAISDHLAILLGLDPEGSVADRETLFFSVRVFIEAVARDRPTVLVFEDVHWADSGLLDLIELLAARLRELPILLLALARPDLLETRPTWGGGLPAYTALPLEPLNPHEARELAGHLLSQSRTSEAVAAGGEGNPLFIEQLAATVLETSPGTDVVLPNSIRGILAARLDALPGSERSLLLDAAVVGKVFWRGALLRMIDDHEQLSELLGALERRDLIRRETVSAFEGDQQFSFTHVLIRDAAYDLLPRARRRERHAQVARFFEEASSEVGEATAALARHWRDAGEAARAIDYFVAAGEQAERGWAKEQAVALYREALELVPDEDAGRRGEIRRKLAVARQAHFHVLDARLLGLGPEEPV